MVGAISLFEGKYGRLISLIEAGSVTQIRTAAASGLATQYLARENDQGPFTVGILGAGVQAESHIEAMIVARDISKVIIWNRTFEKAQSLAQTASEKFGIDVVATKDISEAVYIDNFNLITFRFPQQIFSVQQLLLKSLLLNTLG